MLRRSELITLAGAYVVIAGVVMLVLHAPGILQGAFFIVVSLTIFWGIAAAITNWWGTDL